MLLYNQKGGKWYETKQKEDKELNNNVKLLHLRIKCNCRVGVSPSTGIIPQKAYEKQEKI